MSLVLTKKFFDLYWKLLGWIIYISLAAISIWFTWGVIDKFAKEETAIRQYKDNIEAHPTIAICDFHPSYWEYQKDFNINYTTYQTDEFSIKDEIILKIGGNYLENSGENVTLTIIYTRFNQMCYTINTDRNVDKRETEIKIWSTYKINDRAVFFTSEKNSYGVTRRDWRDGEVYSFSISGGRRKDVTLTVEKNINLKCSEESFYEYVASRLTEQNFEICNDTCLMTSLPNNPFPICPNYDEWYKLENVKMKLDCNWSAVKILIQNITNNDEHLKTCFTTKYSGIYKEGKSLDSEAVIKYKFALPLKAKALYHEYLIIDSIGLIGSVGGTVGMFIGFSFSNLIIYIIHCIQSLTERKLGTQMTSRKKLIQTVWKSLEWMIYLLLLATAILFTMKVIEKFFGKDTGIKQYLEEIESHPTITICPFQEQCGRQGVPYRIIVKLEGTAKDTQSNMEDTYTLGPNLVNGKAHWIQDSISKLHALWYDKKYGDWNIGKIDNLGSSTASIYSPDNSSGPHEATTWKYTNGSKWIESTDIAILPGLPSLCMKDAIYYGTDFNITYQMLDGDDHMHGLTSEEKIPLKIGENYLSVSNEKISLTKIYTRWNSICYKINAKRTVDFRKTEIKLKTSGSKTLATTKIFLTSNENSYGVTNNKFVDGKAFSTQLNGGKWKEIHVSVEENLHLTCRKKSFFEYVTSRLSEINFDSCNYTCVRTSLPNENYPICPNYEDWYDNVLKGNLIEPEDDCNWGIVRDLINDIIIKDEHPKTCMTKDYSGKITTELNDQQSNELGIQYRFAFPLRTKVYQEFLLTDTIDFVGSVGGMLGLFIGFSFSNIIDYMMGYIRPFFAHKNKLSETLWVSIGWIIYLSLMAISIWFSWGVLDKFFKKEIGIQQYEEQIETHPTIVICMGLSKYQTDFKIQHWLDEKIDLEMGENYLKTMNESITLTKVYTRDNGLCYAINTTQRVDERTKDTYILIRSVSSNYTLPRTIPVIFTSEMNSYGIIQRDWRDGEGFSFITSGGNAKDIDLSVEKNVNLKCNHRTFYEYVASRLSEENFEKCNESCLMTSLPNNPFRICDNYNEWYGKDEKRKESNCNWHLLKDLIQHITINEEHIKTCVTTQYLGKITMDREHEYKHAVFLYYKFSLPLKAKVYEEYLITDGFTLIGSVGGTLGLFIGFSIDSFVYSIMEFFKSTLQRRQKSATFVESGLNSNG